MADPAWLQQYDRDLAPLLESYRAQAAQKPQGIFANVDPVMLGLAQGFLSPTKTGGFGESIGLGLAGAQGPLESMRKRQMDAQNKILELQAARAKMAMEAPYLQARADYLASGGSRGPSSDRENRLLYSTLNTDVQKLEWDDTDPPVNPITLQPFGSEQELNQFKNMVRQKLYSTGLSEEDMPKPKKGAAKSNYSSEDGKSETKKDAASTSSSAKNAPPKDYPDAKQGVDGAWYVPDPNRPGKYLKVQ